MFTLKDGEDFESTKLEKYETRSQNIIQLVDRLRDEGASIDIDLPTIVFCGNQSAGKSSLIESISGIMLPRSDGTCTRCPMELRLDSGGSEWSCNVTLHFEYDVDGHNLIRPKEITFVENIRDRNHVELMVRRAQKAILNPSDEPRTFCDYKFDDTTIESRLADANENELKFTLNTVCIKIFGASVNLTLIDLPGIIRTTERSMESGFIGMVEGMVKNHIRNPRALIIATISCKDEIENQAIINLAKEADPEGARTIGVLTKPDTIEANCHDTWFQILNNRRYKLNLGYFIIKNPNKQELDSNISFEEARKNERNFFNNLDPWSKASSVIKSRMGVEKLRNALSARLTELIEASLPSMRKKVAELLELATKEIRDLPPPLDKKPNIELLERIKEYVKLLCENTEAKGEDKDFYRAINWHFMKLGQRLKDSSPILVLPFPCDASGEKILSKVNTPYVMFNDEPAENMDSHFTKEDINKILDQQKGRELTHFIKSEALQHIIKRCQTSWRFEAEYCLNFVEMELKERVNNISDQVFERFQGLPGVIISKTDDLITELHEKCKYMILNTLMMELDYPSTWDIENYDSVCQNIHEQMESPLNSSELETFNNSDKQKINECLTKLSEIGINTNETKLPSLITNMFDDKIRKVMEMSQAYYKIATSRFCDSIPMIVYHFLVLKLSKTIESYLIHELGVFKEDNPLITDLVREKPNVMIKRNECNARIKRLQEVRRNILG